MNENTLPPSPGAHEHISIDLVNTVTTDRNGTHDALDSPDAIAAWLIEHDLITEGSEQSSNSHSQLIALREQIWAVFSALVDGSAIDTSALGGLNAALVMAPLAQTLRFTPESGFYREWEHPTTQTIEHAISIIAEDAALLLAGADAPMLARCEAAPCTRFLLRTHGRRQWCSTRCGDRVRAARAYARKRAREKS